MRVNPLDRILSKYSKSSNSLDINFRPAWKIVVLMTKLIPTCLRTMSRASSLGRIRRFNVSYILKISTSTDGCSPISRSNVSTKSGEITSSSSTNAIHSVSTCCIPLFRTLPALFFPCPSFSISSSRTCGVTTMSAGAFIPSNTIIAFQSGTVCASSDSIVAASVCRPIVGTMNVTIGVSIFFIMLFFLPVPTRGSTRSS